jgi:hypothetical protein
MYTMTAADLSTSRGIILIVLAVMAALAPQGGARKLVYADPIEPPLCTLQPAAPHKPPTPTQCPCGPSVQDVPFSGEDVVIVLEAWPGYCKKRGPWFTAPDQHSVEVDDATSVHCAADQACCLSMTYFIDGKKPMIREFMSCIGDAQDSAAETESLPEPETEKLQSGQEQQSLADQLQEMLQAFTGGFKRVPSSQHQSADAVDGSDDSDARSEDVYFHARLSDAVKNDDRRPQLVETLHVDARSDVSLPEKASRSPGKVLFTAHEALFVSLPSA